MEWWPLDLSLSVTYLELPEAMKPEEALQEQVRRYQRMTGEQRLVATTRGLRPRNAATPSSGNVVRGTCLDHPAEDSILHKLVWNQITPSDRQLGDAAGVVAVQQEKLDRAYLHKCPDS